MRTAEIFSKQASEYAKFRPHYPGALYEYLSGETQGHAVAWDCGTGSGQAAVQLAKFYDRVFATDPSQKQLDNAEKNPKVQYAVGKAEESHLADASVDLITVAQAFHWFDHPKFFKEVKRVLKPDGLLAVWTYNVCEIDPKIDQIVWDFYEGVLGPYWEPQRKLVEEGYAKCEFPMKELKAPAFHMSAHWNVEQLIGYLSTWSALQTYLQKNDTNPLPAAAEKLRAAWGSEAKKVTWPLYMRVGRTA